MQADNDSAKASDIILEPRDIDVIFGRERPIFEHPGNRRFRVTIAMHVNRYESAKTRHEKSKVVKAVFSLMRNAGIRFLKPCSEGIIGYYEVDDKMARNKVAHAMRDANSKYNSKSLVQDAIRLQEQQLEQEQHFLQHNGAPSSPGFARQVSIDRPERKAQHDFDDFEPIPLHEIGHLEYIDDDQESKVLDEFSDIPRDDMESFFTPSRSFSAAAAAVVPEELEDGYTRPTAEREEDGRRTRFLAIAVYSSYKNGPVEEDFGIQCLDAKAFPDEMFTGSTHESEHDRLVAHLKGAASSAFR
jgi:hypothetical protein